LNTCVFSFKYYPAAGMVIISGIAFIAAVYNNNLTVIHPAMSSHNDAGASLCCAERQLSPAIHSSSIIFALI
jgi:hypothetical protein